MLSSIVRQAARTAGGRRSCLASMLPAVGSGPVRCPIGGALTPSTVLYVHGSRYRLLGRPTVGTFRFPLQRASRTLSPPDSCFRTATGTAGARAHDHTPPARTLLGMQPQRAKVGLGLFQVGGEVVGRVGHVSLQAEHAATTVLAIERKQRLQVFVVKIVIGSHGAV